VSAAATAIILKNCIRTNLTRLDSMANGTRALEDVALNNRTFLKDFRRLVTRTAFDVLDIKDEAEFISRYSPVTATATFLAGVGSRWVDSVNIAGAADVIDTSLPRCTALVDDVLDPGSKIPIGTYNLRAVKGLGSPYIIWGSHRDLIEQIAAAAGMENASFVRQAVPEGAKGPLGHGDAMASLLPELPSSVKFVVCNFGGGAHSRETILSSLAILAALQHLDGSRPSGVLPVGLFEAPKYLVVLDAKGAPVEFRHNRLKGSDGPLSPGLSNIGVRLYLKDALPGAVDHFRQFLNPEHSEYIIPGNSERTFALDNIDELLSNRKELETPCIANPIEENGTVKEYQNIGYFIEAQKLLLGVK